MRPGQRAYSTAPAGLLCHGGAQIPLTNGDSLSTPAEIANLKLTARDGRAIYAIYMRDVTFVSDLDKRHVATLRRDIHIPLSLSDQPAFGAARMTLLCSKKFRPGGINPIACV